jgi:hypothetical protein
VHALCADASSRLLLLWCGELCCRCVHVALCHASLQATPKRFLRLSQSQANASNARFTQLTCAVHLDRVLLMHWLLRAAQCVVQWGPHAEVVYYRAPIKGLQWQAMGSLTGSNLMPYPTCGSAYGGFGAKKMLTQEPGTVLGERQQRQQVPCQLLRTQSFCWRGTASNSIVAYKQALILS